MTTSSPQTAGSSPKTCSDVTALAKVFVFTRDEYDLIEDFLTYHGTLFGYQNLVVIDNDSRHPDVLKVYDRFRAMGVEIVIDRRDMNHFPRILTEHMLRHRESARFLVPLDTDEFIFHSQGDDVAASMARISDEDVCITRFKEVYESVADPTQTGYVRHKHSRPAREITNFRVQGWDKVFFSSRYFRSVSHGNHDGSVTGGRREVSPELCLLHFHNTGRRRQLERSIMSIRGYKHVNLVHLDAALQHFGPDISSDHDGKPPPLDGLERVLRQAETIIRNVGLFGGHRIEHFYAIMVRRWLVEIFRGITGRIPSRSFVDHMLASRPGSFLDLKVVVEYMPKDPAVDFHPTREATADDVVFVEEDAVATGRPGEEHQKALLSPTHQPRLRCTYVHDALLGLSSE